MLYSAGRVFQLIGLIALPSAIWVAEFGRNEKGAIAIFLASMLVFLLGFLMTRAVKG